MSFTQVRRSQYLSRNVIHYHLSKVKRENFGLCELCKSLCMLMCVCDILYVCVGVYILIGVGALMMVVGFLGCCGAIQESPCMLGLVRTTFTTFTTNIKYKLFKTNSFFLTV